MVNFDQRLLAITVPCVLFEEITRQENVIWYNSDVYFDGGTQKDDNWSR